MASLLLKGDAVQDVMPQAGVYDRENSGFCGLPCLSGSADSVETFSGV